MQLPGARMGPAWGQAGWEGRNATAGSGTLEWVIGAAVILGTLAAQRDYPPNHGVRTPASGQGPAFSWDR